MNICATNTLYIFTTRYYYSIQTHTTIIKGTQNILDKLFLMYHRP